MKGLFIGFIIIQLAIDLAHSLTIFPFVHYGMFSESFSRPDSLTVFEITADGKRLNPADFPVYRWDQVQNPLYAIEKEHQTSDFAFDKEKMKAGFQWIGADSLFQHLSPNLDNLWTNPTIDPVQDDTTADLADRFQGWYKDYLGRLIGHPIQRLEVDKAWYRYTDGRMVMLKKENRINL